MGEIFAVTSLKGGVGKTVFSAGLAFAFAQAGRRVLAVDLDLGTGGLDIALGRENMICATFPDLLLGNVPFDRAFVFGEDGIAFLSAPAFFNERDLEGVRQETVNRLLEAFKQEFDVVLFDMPAGGGAAFRFLEDSGLVDRTFLVTTSAPTAVRAAERCAARLREPEKCGLILNCYRLTKPEDNSFRILEVIRRTSVPIRGVIPFDALSEKALMRGIPLTGFSKSLAGKAISNIARRLGGESVPLLEGVMKKNKRERFY